MAPKKDKQKPVVFSEVERAFYELQLADCNRKLARLRKAVDDYEIRNEELQKSYDTLDEDRADIIAYLKKTLNVKTDENTELKGKVKELEELREIETEQFNVTVTELEKDFSKMKDQLTSENKLLAGKLNTLEEFRAIKEDLLKKFERQEHAFEDQEMKYKRIIYNTEKKFVIGKDKLKKEMEERLLKLAQEFQDASEMRIAASTHRVIRENIALNNQLDSLLITQAKVSEQNEKFREDERASRCAKEVAEEERDKAMNKSIVQLKVIDKLTAAFEDVKKQKAMYEKKLFNTEKMRSVIQKLTKENENLKLQVRILEQNLHATLGEQNKTVVETAKLLRECETYKKILKESSFIVKASIKLDQWSISDPSREIIDRKVLLNKILEVINQYHDAAQAESMESLVSLSKIYEKGELDFEYKSVAPRTQATADGLGSGSLIPSFEDKRSTISVSSKSSSSVSMNTIPSIQVLPLKEMEAPSIHDSLPSFTVTSLHSSVSSSITEGQEDEIHDISKMLAISKVEMQKSLMADLAFSRISQQTMNVLDSKSKLDILHQKSGEAINKTSEEKPSVTPGEVEKELIVSGEPTHDSSEPINETGEPTNDIGEPVVADQEDTEEDEKKKTSAE